MSENKLTLSGVCPYCPAVLDYPEDAKAVLCHSCGNAVPTSILRPLNYAQNTNTVGEKDKRIAEGVTSATAGLIYFDNFCESYDWKSFALNSDLSISTLDAIAEACKIKFSADPLTYYLDFRCIAIPLLRKIDGLDVIELEIIDNYKSDDISDLFSYVDLYSTITHEIAEKRESIIKALATDIMLAKRFYADELIVADLEKSYELFVEKISSVSIASTIEDIPGYQKAKELKDAKLSEKIRAKGIDAEKTYRKAMILLENGRIDNALHLFVAINGYKDSTERIADYSRIFKFNNELVEMAKNFYYVQNNSGYTLRPSITLYKIENGTVSGVPALTHMSDVIHSFGSRIFYVRDSSSLCCYDTADKDIYKNVKILDDSEPDGYITKGNTPIYYSSDKSKFIIRKRLPEDELIKRGCFGKKKKIRNVSDAIARGNNYSVVLVDMDNAVATTILPEIVDILYYHNDRIFYTSVPEGSLDRDPSFYMYDIATGTNTRLLNNGFVIHDVNDGHVIYSVNSPNGFNFDLYSSNIETGEHTLLCKNVSGFRRCESSCGRVFYTVGTGNDTRLYSSSTDGDDVIEIMERPGRISVVRSGWLYYVSGEGMNTCLMKVKIDGSEHALVASRFEKLVKMVNGYVFYISTSGDLRSVRSDGNGDTRIASNISDTHVIIDENNVYYLKHDMIGKDELHEDGYGLSLYITDHLGKNLRKLAHDVKAIQEYNDRYIYICKQRNNKYKITTPIDKRTSRTEIVTKSLTYYEAYDKETGSFAEIVNFGTPTPTSITYKKSWWPFSKKTVTKRGTVVPMQNRNTYSDLDSAPLGMLRDSATKSDIEEQALIAAEKQAKKDAKIEKKENAKREKLQRKEEKHNRAVEEIDAFNVETERLAEEEKAKREAEEAEKARLEAEEAKRAEEEDARRVEEEARAAEEVKRAAEDFDKNSSSDLDDDE